MLFPYRADLPTDYFAILYAIPVPGQKILILRFLCDPHDGPYVFHAQVFISLVPVVAVVEFKFPFHIMDDQGRHIGVLPDGLFQLFHVLGEPVRVDAVFHIRLQARRTGGTDAGA